MATPPGWFDESAVRSGWFDATEMVSSPANNMAWFDVTLGGNSSGMNAGTHPKQTLFISNLSRMMNR